MMDPIPALAPPRQNGSPKPESSAAAPFQAKQDDRTQPWKQYMDEIVKERQNYNKNNSVDTDYFKVSEGFNDHGISG